MHKQIILFITLNSKFFIIIAVILISLIALILRYQRLSGREIWFDEYNLLIPTANSVYQEELPLLDVVKQNLKILQFPGDVVMVWTMYHFFGRDKYMLALPHMLITILGFFLLYKLCQIYLKTVWGFLAAFSLVCFNDNLIYHAFEIRPYSVLAVLSLASFLAMKKIVETQSPSLFEKIYLNLFIVLILLFHMYGSWILLFTYIYHFVVYSSESKLQLLKRHLKFYCFGVIIALPVWLYFTFGFDKKYLNYDTFEFIHKGIIPMLKGVFGNLIGFKPFYIFLLSFFAWVLPTEVRLKQIIFFSCLIALPITLLFFICLSNHYYFIQRLFVWEMPLFAFLLGWQVDSLLVYISRKN